MPKTVIYTTIINPEEPFGIEDNIDSLRLKSSDLKLHCICYTNNPKMKSTKEVEVIYVPTKKTDDPKIFARKIKFLPHLFLPEEYDQSIWVDAKMNALKPLDKVADSLLKDGDFFAKAHDKRNCVYAEAETCIKGKHADPSVIRKQADYYRKKGYPKNNGLVATGIIFRNHKSEALIKCEEFWFDQINSFCARDQISFPFSAWSTNFQYKLIPNSISGPNWFPYFQAWHHRIKRGRKTAWY